MSAQDLAAPTSKSEGVVSSKSRARAAPVAGRYRTLFVLGRGGMGSVEAALELHRAEHGEGAPSSPDGRAYERVVALKRLLPDAAHDARRVEMFLREARLAAMLHHPNVVRAFDYGEADGELYLAMEYVEGQPLSAVLRKLADEGGSLDTALAAHVLTEICEGLHAAHELTDEKGQPLALVHRDVSPQNVMLAYDGQVRLLDFGVAKIEAESVTKTGEVKGKTAYMSPEQAMGDPIDRRSDLFGVGAVLFECLTGKRMWGDGTDMDVIRKLALEEPPELPDGGPEEMRALHKRLVAREAKDRPATARDVAEALRAMARDGAKEEIQALLERHFGEQVEALRRRLAGALDEVAPDQAEALRESVLPTSDRAPTRSASAAPAPAAEAPARKWTAPVIGIVVVAGAIAAWRASTTGPAPDSMTIATATIAASASASASASAAAAASAPASASASAAAAASASASAAASAPASATARRLVPTRPSTSASAKPRPSAPPSSKPLDVDERPF